MSCFRVARDELLTALTLIAPAQRKTLLPILGCTLIRSTADGLSVTASDLDLTITKQFAGEGQLVALTAAVLLADLLAIVAEMPAGALDVDCATPGKMTLKAGRARMTLLTMPAEEFPAPRPIVFPATPVPWGPIAHALERVIWAAAQNDTGQPVFNGVSWRVASGALYLAATNRYQLASATLSIPTGGISDANLIVPARAVGVALKVFAGAETVFVGVDAEGTHLGLRSAQAALTVRLTDGLFPNYDQMFPVEAQETLVVDVAELATATRRVATLTTPENRRIEYALTAEACTASVRTPDRGDATDSVEPLAWQGDPLTIGFDSTLVLGALAAVGTAQVQLAFHGSRGAMVLTPVDPKTAEVWRAIVMPRAASGAA